MKNLFKKINTITLLIASLSLVLVGCGTGADSGGMGSQSSNAISLLK